MSTDAELVAAVRRGDDRAFEELYARYQRRIAAYVFGMVKDHARAEDLTQDVFMSALRRMRDTDRPIAFKPWIYEIAKNACIDQFRRARRADEVSYDASDDGLGSGELGRLTAREATPDAAFESKQDLDHLRGALGGLSEAHHQILVMREFEGLSYREIGDRMGMSRPSVESTLFRARKRLTEEYDELVSGARCVRIQSLVSSAGAGALGIRERRRMARHLSYCQPCRRAAFAAGREDLVPGRASLGAKIAALLPLPAFLRRRLFGGGSGGGSGDAVQSSGAFGGHAVAQWASVLEPTSAGWTKAVATAATVVVAGVGAQAVTHTSAPAPAGSFDPSAVLGGGHDARSASAGRAVHGGGAAASRDAAQTGAPARAHVAGGRGSGSRSSSSTGAAGGGASGTLAAGSSRASDPAAGTGPGTAARGGQTGGGGHDLSSATHRLGSGSSGGPSSVTSHAPLSVPQVPAVQAPNVQVPSALTGPKGDQVNGAAGAAPGAVTGAANDATGAVNGALGGR